MRPISLAACLALALLCGCKETPEPSPNYREYAYVSNGGSNSVTVIDLRALAILTTVSVGRSPTGLAVNPRKNEIYVANTESNNISVIDAETNKVVSTIGVHRAPYFIDVSRDGKRAYL
ncbi:MAG TPA: YncE family protein, partial [Alphaproteobacteria bacterium]|nr:YncE family protein [Alphaproteobacteria bacterium]